jgi:hypothetical protein
MAGNLAFFGGAAMGGESLAGVRLEQGKATEFQPSLGAVIRDRFRIEEKYRNINKMEHLRF